MGRDHQQDYAQDYDTIVIGSGIGGLAVASLLGQLAGHRVLVLERHFKLGGFTHSFSRPARLGRSGASGRYRWEAGVHYVGEMAADDQMRRLFDLVTAGGVSWNPLPDRFDRFHFPDLQVGVPSDPQRYYHELQERFPNQHQAIDAWFGELDRAAGWMMRAFGASVAPEVVGRFLTRPGRSRATQTVADALDAAGVTDARLRAVLAAQWGDYGLPPSRAPMALHALVATHYQHGAWFPAGGTDTIAQSVREIVEDAGGACLVNHEVTDILLDPGRRRVRGVRVRTRAGSVELAAPRVVSDAGARVTYQRLLPDLGLPQQAAPAAEAPTTAVTLYLGLREDPRVRLATEGGNHWLFTGYDHDQLHSHRSSLLDGHAQAAFVSFGTVRSGIDDPHSAQVIAFTDHAPFQTWADQRWRRRGSDYDELKQRIGDALLRLADEHLPGLAALVDYREVATPLTVTSMAGHPQGAIYATPITPQALRQRRNRPTTPVSGLTLAGADAATLGIGGAMMGGVLAAASTLGPLGYPRILRAARHAPQDRSPRPVTGSRNSTDAMTV